MKVEDLLKGTEFAECERSVLQDGEVEHDGRLDKFLKSLSDKGTVSAIMGYKITKEGTGTRRYSIPETESNLCSFKIVDGTMLKEDARKILSYLDIMGVKEALPTFCGDWETFVLKDGTWEPYTGGEKCNKMFFFTCDSYSSVNW
jgi:hypothetical protein